MASIIAALCSCALTWLGSILKKTATIGKITKRKYVITMSIRIAIMILSDNDLANVCFNIFLHRLIIKKGVGKWLIYCVLLSKPKLL